MSASSEITRKVAGGASPSKSNDQGKDKHHDHALFRPSQAPPFETYRVGK